MKTIMLLGVLCLITADILPAHPLEQVRLIEQMGAGQARNGPGPVGQDLRQIADTTWFGGLNEAEGIAYNSADDGYDTAVWTWDAGTADPLEGWMNDDWAFAGGVYFGRVAADSFTVHGDPYVPMFPGETGQLWLGAHEDEANELGWVAGMGYGNDWCQDAISPPDPMAPAWGTLIDFKYFQDSEDQYDYTSVQILCYQGSTLVQRYEVARLTGKIGSYQSPATFSASVPYSVFSPAPDMVRLCFHFVSDAAWSDQDGGYDSEYGAFAADDVSFIVGSMSDWYDFDDDTWFFTTCSGAHGHINVCTETQWSTWILGPPAVSGPCYLSGNALYCATGVSGSPFPGHPDGSFECISSAIVDRGPFTSDLGWVHVIARWDPFYYLPASAATFIRPAFRYYPYTTLENPTPRWSPPLGEAAWHFGDADPECVHNEITSLSHPDGGTPLPDDWECMRLTFELLTDCGSFAIPPDQCDEVGRTNGSPVYDNVRVGITGDPAAVGDETDAGGAASFLYPARPNPFRHAAAIRFSIAAEGPVRIAITDVAGRHVRTLFDGKASAGETVLTWDGKDDRGRSTGPGIFWVEMSAPGYESSKRVVVLR